MRPPSSARRFIAGAVAELRAAGAEADADARRYSYELFGDLTDVNVASDVRARCGLPPVPTLSQLLDAVAPVHLPESPGRLAHQVAEVGCPPQRADRQLVPTDRTRALATCLGCGHLVRAHAPLEGCMAEGCGCNRSDHDALRDFGAELEASAELALRDFAGCSSRRIDGYCGEQGADVVRGLDTCPKGRP